MPDPFVYKEQVQSWFGIFQQPTAPPSLPHRFSFLLHNMVLRRGMPHVRPGLVQLNGVRFGDGDYTVHGLYVWTGSPDMLIVACGTKLQQIPVGTGGDPTDLTETYPSSGYGGRTGAATVMARLGNRLFIVNGTDPNIKYNGTSLARMGVAAPTTLAAPAKGAGTFNGTWTYRATLVSSNAMGAVESEPTSVTSVTYANQQGTFSAPSPINADPQVTHWNLYRVPQGGSTYYRVNTSPALLAATIVDTVTDGLLTSGTQMTTLLYNSVPPGIFKTIAVHQGRLLGVLPNSNVLYWSDLGIDAAGIYAKPESWPPGNNLQFGELGGNSITAVVSFYEWVIVFQDFGVWTISGDLANEEDRIIRPVLVASDRRGVGVSYIGNIAAAENKILFVARDGMYEITRDPNAIRPDLAIRQISHNISNLHQQIDFSSGGASLYDRDQRRYIFWGKGQSE